MKLAELRDEDLQKVAMLKTRKGIATSEAKRAQQILYTRNISKGGFGGIGQCLDCNLNHPTRERKTFEELNGCSLEDYGKP